MDNNEPIGIFDSGIGGTSIWKEIQWFAPNEKTIYLADSKNVPYGQKSKRNYCIKQKNTDLLLKMAVNWLLLHVTRQTQLREKYDVPFIGIEPAINLLANSKTQIIGILATQGTLNSELFNKAAEMFVTLK
jgi:glutamate racemase